MATRSVSVPQRPNHPMNDDTNESTYEDTYDLIEELGRGGFGSVFRARNRHTGEECALKLVRHADDEALLRHAREVQSQRALQHHNIMPILDAGTGWHTMPLAKTSLKERGPALYPVEIARVLFDIARGLAAAHEAKLVHRDVSHGNILLLNGRWVLSDFGCVRRLAGDSETITVGVVGTPNFAPPEAWSIGAHDVDHRGDICSLGRVIRWALTSSPGGNVDSEWHVIDSMTARDRNNRSSLEQVLRYDGTLQEKLRDVQRRAFEERGREQTIELALEESALTVLKLILCLDPNFFTKDKVKTEANARGVSPMEVNLGWMHLSDAAFFVPVDDGTFDGAATGLSEQGQQWARNHDRELRQSPLPMAQPSTPAGNYDIPF